MIAALLVSPVVHGVVNHEKEFKRGDVNADGLVDNSDIIALQNYLYQGTFTIPCDDAADANDDERLDNSDVIYLMEYLYDGGAPPPAPSAWYCGYEQTPSGLDCESYYCY